MRLLYPGFLSIATERALANSYLFELRVVVPEIEHALSGEPGEVDGALGPVVKCQLNPVVLEYGGFGDLVHVSRS